MKLWPLTKLYFNTTGDLVNLKKSAANDMLFLLGLHTLLLSNNPRKTLRFAAFLDKNYRPEILDKHESQYGFFVKAIEANAYFEMGEMDKVSAIYNSISLTYKRSSNLLTSFMKIIFHSLKIRLMVNTVKENQIAIEMKNINNIASQFGYKFARLYIISILLKSPTLQDSAPELYKQVTYDFNKVIREAGLNSKLFLQTIAIRK